MGEKEKAVELATERQTTRKKLDQKVVLDEKEETVELATERQTTRKKLD